MEIVWERGREREPNNKSKNNRRNSSNKEEKPRPFLIFVYFTHLVPPTGFFRTNFFLPAIQANLVSLPFSPVCCPAISAKKAPPDSDNCVK